MILEALAAFNDWWFNNIVRNGGYIFLLLLALLIPLQISTWRMRRKNQNRYKEFERQSRDGYKWI